MDRPSAAPDNRPSLLLAVDTSGPACQAVVAEGTTVLAGRSQPMLRGHGEALIPMVEAVLADAGVEYEALDRLGTTIGPGSFTGIRVGLSAARSFAATLNLPLVPIGTLEALALSDALETGLSAPRAVALDARNDQVYGQRFNAEGKALDEPASMADLVFVASIERNSRLIGSAQPVLAALARASNKPVTLGLAEPVPRLAALAQLTAEGTPVAHPSPLYLKPVDAVAAKPSGLRAGAV